MLNYVISSDNVNEKRSRSLSLPSAKVANARSALPSLRQDNEQSGKLLAGVALPPIRVNSDDDDDDDDENADGNNEEIIDNDADVKNKIMLDLYGASLDEK